jgi:hypothetical protein
MFLRISPTYFSKIFIKMKNISNKKVYTRNKQEFRAQNISSFFKDKVQSKTDCSDSEITAAQ